MCSCGAGRPPRLERSDGAATLLEKVAAHESSIELRKGEEDRSPPEVGPGVGGAGISSRLLRYQVEFATLVVRQTGIDDSLKDKARQCNDE